MSGLIPYIVGSLTDLASRFEKIENEKITTPKIETELLCVGDTCLTEEEVIKLKILLEN